MDNRQSYTHIKKKVQDPGHSALYNYKYVCVLCVCVLTTIKMALPVPTEFEKSIGKVTTVTKITLHFYQT